MSLVASGKLSPQVLVESLVQLEIAELESEPFGTLMLIVGAPEDDDAGVFLEQLISCVMKESPPISGRLAWPSTTEFPTVRIKERTPVDADQVELIAELASAPHCLVPLRETSPKRVFTLGRAQNLDIVLSDPSVSADHARIQITDGGLTLRDVGSKNGTTHNGTRLSPTDSPWLQPMDRLTFGRVKAFVCDPRALRGVLRQDLRTLL